MASSAVMQLVLFVAIVHCVECNEVHLFEDEHFESSAEIGHETASAVRATASAGSADSQYMMGVLLFYGHGVGKNASLASQWFMRASAQGHTLAKGNLALMHEHGVGVPKDLLKAQSYLQDTVDRNPRNAQAAWLLGKFLYEGKSSLPQARAHVMARTVSLCNYARATMFADKRFAVLHQSRSSR